MITYATTYPNPDTDGIACVLVFAEYLRSVRSKQAEAVVKGRLNEESLLVLRVLDLEPPRSVDSCDGADEVYLFDTHHLAQVGGFVEPSKVAGIIDHHPGGDPEAFDKAAILNEQVGAAATLVTEKLRNEHYTISRSHTGLLQAGIISNTLNFSAPTATERDREAADWLGSVVQLPADLPLRMLRARSDFGTRSTRELLEGDCKVFTLGGRDVAICQLEGVDVDRVIKREDLLAALATMASARRTDLALLSAVDIVAKSTTIVPANDHTSEILTSALGLSFENNAATVDRILLRKSDLVPALKTLLEER